MSRKVTVEINQQQAELLDRLLADGGYGADYAEIVRTGFRRFCESHPEVAGRAERKEGS
jgi:Arc/MetJ-type ribon-helix-helix transcriptional regulator